MLKRLLGTEGFTLLENILATLILGAGLTAGMMTLHHTTTSTVNMDLTSIATGLANEKVEQILADKQFVGYEYLDNEDNYPVEKLSGDYKQFTRKVSIVEVNEDDFEIAESGTGLKKVVVDVTWGTEAYQKVSVSTLVADYM